MSTLWSGAITSVSWLPSMFCTQDSKWPLSQCLERLIWSWLPFLIHIWMACDSYVEKFGHIPSYPRIYIHVTGFSCERYLIQRMLFWGGKSDLWIRPCQESFKNTHTNACMFKNGKQFVHQSVNKRNSVYKCELRDIYMWITNTFVNRDIYLWIKRLMGLHNLQPVT